jgi:hypothetical protein
MAFFSICQYISEVGGGPTSGNDLNSKKLTRKWPNECAKTRRAIKIELKDLFSRDFNL